MKEMGGGGDIHKDLAIDMESVPTVVCWPACSPRT